MCDERENNILKSLGCTIYRPCNMNGRNSLRLRSFTTGAKIPIIRETHARAGGMAGGGGRQKASRQTSSESRVFSLWFSMVEKGLIR